jgi:hypothetical protein
MLLFFYTYFTLLEIYVLVMKKQTNKKRKKRNLSCREGRVSKFGYACDAIGCG